MSENKQKIIDSVVPKLSIKMDLFPDISAITSQFKDLTKGFAEMQKSIVDFPAVKQLSETFSSIHKSWVCDIAEKFPDITSIFSPIRSVINDDVLKKIRYLNSLDRSGWPLFHLHFQDPDYVSSLKEDDYFPYMLFFYKDEYKKNLIESWKKAPIIKDCRKPVLEEALTLFDHHFYYGTCSILMCQLYGIAEDLDCYSKEHSLVISDDDIKGIDELYGIENPKKVPKEKRRLFQKLMHIRKGILWWDKTLQYINNFVLKNPQKPVDDLAVPHRNKICHGEQLNFGTQEHALKAIFIIDSLIKFSNAIYSSTRDK